MYPPRTNGSRETDYGKRFNDDYDDFTKMMIEANGEEYPGQYY